MRLIASFGVLVTLLISLGGCGVYSFTGSTLSPEVKTMSIQTFFNNAPLGPSNMSVVFTENIKDYFQQNTNLILVDEEGDLQMEGFIDNYTLTPVAANASGSGGVDFANQMRIAITVSVVYVNVLDDTFNFDKKFSFFKDYDQSSTDINAVEDEFVQEIFEQIIVDIFNSSVANW